MYKDFCIVLKASIKCVQIMNLDCTFLNDRGNFSRVLNFRYVLTGMISLSAATAFILLGDGINVINMRSKNVYLHQNIVIFNAIFVKTYSVHAPFSTLYSYNV